MPRSTAAALSALRAMLPPAEYDRVAGLLTQFDQLAAASPASTAEEFNHIQETLKRIVAELEPLEREYLPALCEGRDGPCDVLISSVGLQAQPVLLMAELLRPRFHLLLPTQTPQSLAVAAKIQSDERLWRLRVQVHQFPVDETDIARNWLLFRDRILPWIRQRVSGENPRICVDLTGGLKAQVALVSAIGNFFKLPIYYLHGETVKVEGPEGKRATFVRPFSEELVRLPDPSDLFGDASRRQVAMLFNTRDYAAALRTCRQVEQSIADAREAKFFELLAELIAVYDDWDLWGHSPWRPLPGNQHRLADRLQQVLHAAERFGFRFADEEQLARNLRFLAQLQEEWRPESGESLAGEALLVDLYMNGVRRMYQQKYDDAMIRFFRVLELAVDRWLHQKYGVNVRSPDYDGLAHRLGMTPDDLLHRYAARSGGRLPPPEFRYLSEKAALLRVLKDEMAAVIRKAEAGKVREVRNHSLLAHGIAAVSEQECRHTQAVAAAALRLVLDSSRRLEDWLADAQHPVLTMGEGFDSPGAVPPEASLVIPTALGSGGGQGEQVRA